VTRSSVPAAVVCAAHTLDPRTKLAAASDVSKRAFIFSPPGTPSAVEVYLATRMLNGS
jgi:hypothetical protein